MSDMAGESGDGATALADGPSEKSMVPATLFDPDPGDETDDDTVGAGERPPGDGPDVGEVPAPRQSHESTADTGPARADGLADLTGTKPPDADDPTGELGADDPSPSADRTRARRLSKADRAERRKADRREAERLRSVQQKADRQEAARRTAERAEADRHPDNGLATEEDGTGAQKAGSAKAASPQAGSPKAGRRSARENQRTTAVRTRKKVVRAATPAVTVSTVGRAWRALVDAVGELLEGRARLWALEAGAGPRTLFDLPEDAYIVGVDRDLGALEANSRLDQRIPVDLADYRPQAAGFDLISCWYVLDELPDPAAVLDRFAQWSGSGGLVVLGVPNLRSPRGLFARLSGRLKLRRAITPYSLRQRFDEHGFTPVFQVYYEDSDQVARRRRLHLTRGRWTVVQALVRLLSFGILDAARTDYLVVFRRDE